MTTDGLGGSKWQNLADFRSGARTGQGIDQACLGSACITALFPPVMVQAVSGGSQRLLFGNADRVTRPDCMSADGQRIVLMVTSEIVIMVL